MEGSTDVEEVPMKCRKCRHILLVHPEVRVEDSHGEPCGALLSPNLQGTTRGACKSEVWYVPEECMPEWISSNLEKGDWVKGKINCPKCSARIGSYNFVSGLKCPCGSNVVPPIHIGKAKVDFVHRLKLQQMEPGVQITASSAVLANQQND